MSNHAFGKSAELSRRQVLQLGGLAAGTCLVPRLRHAGGSASARHVLSLIGDCSTVGAVISTVAYGGMPLDLAVSPFPDFRNAFLLGDQQPSTDNVYRHDLNNRLMPGQRYYARLMSRGKPFGRSMAFRTSVTNSTPMSLRIALLSCQRNADTTDGSQLGWAGVKAYQPDLLLHGGDVGYWGGGVSASDPYTKHIEHYCRQFDGLPLMRDVLESCASLIQVSDHETSMNDGDNWQDPVTAHALQAYFRMMPYRSFDDPTRSSRFLTRRLGPNVRLISLDFRSLERSPAGLPDNALKRAFGLAQFAQFRNALRAPEALKIVLSDPGCAPADAPDDPDDYRRRDKWCNYQTAYQEWVDVVRNELTTDGKPIQVDVWSCDRHLLGITKAVDNRWGPFDVLTSSGIDQDANGLEPGETYTTVYGDRKDSHRDLKVHMEIDLTDEKAGTITRTVRGVDDITGAVVMSDTRVWGYAA
jgi:hypothetical protein